VTYAPPSAPDDAPQGPRGVGPLALLVPIVALLGFALWRQARGAPLPSAIGTAEAPESERGAVPVAGFAGECAAPDGERWTARLAPLHALAERQEFDARALQQRLGLPDGAPWRLTLERPAALGAPDVAVAAVAVAGFEPIAGFSAGSSAGPSEPAVGARAAHDPVRVLLAARPFTLAAGARRDVVFWRPRVAAEGAERVELTLTLAGEVGTLSAVLAGTRLAEPRAGESLARLPDDTHAADGAASKARQEAGR